MLLKKSLSISKLILVFGFILSGLQWSNAQTLVVPPGPGDLSQASHLWQSDDYVVEVKKSGDADFIPCYVYKTDNWASNYWNGERRPQVSVSFTNFSFDGTPVDVRITTNFTANSVTIRPLSFGINPTRNGNVITFTLTTQRKISVEVNNRLNPLFIFADKPDVVPNPSDVTHFYGPGYHNIGLHKQINSNETVYIAGGAVLEGTFYIPTNSHDITVRGRGIISGGKLPTAVERTNKIDSIQKYAAFTGRKDKYGRTVHYNLNFEGFTMVSTCGTHFAMVNEVHQNHDNTFRNLKEIDWSVNTDNVFDGDNNIVDDCFFFLNDDMTVTRSSFNLKITNCTFWNFIGRLLWTANYGTSSDCLWENIEVIGDDKGPDFTDINSGTSGIMKNFTFRNVNIESRASKFINIKTGTTKIENWLFENITFPDLKPNEGAFVGNSSGTIDITFKNLKMGGNYITSLEEGNMTANQHCDIKFQVSSSPNINIKQGSIEIPNNTGNFNFGDVPYGTPKTVTFTIENMGSLPLNLTGTPKVAVTGTGFSLESDAPAVVNALGNVTFQVKLTATSNSAYSGTISIANNELSKNPFNFNLSGYGYDETKEQQTITFGALPNQKVYRFVSKK